MLDVQAMTMELITKKYFLNNPKVDDQDGRSDSSTSVCAKLLYCNSSTFLSDIATGSRRARECHSIARGRCAYTEQ